jgi:anthranilate phosphoribosyltransferase
MPLGDEVPMPPAENLARMAGARRPRTNITMLSDIAPLIRRLAEGKDLTSEETKEILVVTSTEENEGYYYLAFTAAIMAKGLTEEELYGLVQGLQTFSISVPTLSSPDEIIDVSGSGGDTLKTFNVSTAAALTVAAHGIKVSKQCFRALTSLTGSSDVLQEVGVSFPRTPEAMGECLDHVGIVPLNYSYLYPGIGNRLRVLSKYREIGLQLPTPMHPIAFVPSPVPMRNRVYGLFDRRYLAPVGRILQRLGYTRVMLCHGTDGLDEISTVGATLILELAKDRFQEYTVRPQDLGVPKGAADRLRPRSREEGTDIFLRVLRGVAHEDQRNIVAANAGAAIYITGRVSSLVAGVEEAQRLLHEGAPYCKLEELVEHTSGHAGRDTLSKAASRAGIQP